MENLPGFGVRAFRSFGTKQTQILSPLGTVNLIAGQNNTGKSNVLRFAQQVLGGRVPTRARQPAKFKITLDGLDLPNGGYAGSQPEIALPIMVNQDAIYAILDKSGRRYNSNLSSSLYQAFDHQIFHPGGDDLTWIRYALRISGTEQTDDGPKRFYDLEVSDAYISEIVNVTPSSLVHAIREAASVLTRTSGPEPKDDWMRVLASFDVLATTPPVATIDAFRRVRESDPNGTGATHSGAGLIEALAKLERPSIEQQDDRTRFRAIRRFVGTVLDDPDVEIEVPYHRRTIHVRHNGLILPLENLGTGIHQVVILAAAATVLTDHLVCIEEPEIHLHPLLQRKLLRYLAEETSNQYLIATHSAHLLDAELASIFHVTLTDKGTDVQLAVHPKDLAAICADLGYRPSDLVQANAVVWVEGPSDRIFLRHWISLLAPQLVEGIHYSLMFYGGRLLNHLSADDPDIDDFISLRRLNRNIAVLIDSDKKSSRANVNATKKRVVNEFNEGPGFAWVTKGYTIENYVPPELLATAVTEAHSKAKLNWDGDLWTNPLGERALSGGKTSIDKVAVARACVNHWDESTSWPHDLDRKVQQTVDFIREANGI